MMTGKWMQGGNGDFCLQYLRSVPRDHPWTKHFVVLRRIDISQWYWGSLEWNVACKKSIRISDAFRSSVEHSQNHIPDEFRQSDNLK